MRIYLSEAINVNDEFIKNIIVKGTLIYKNGIKRIYSKEGIFELNNNVLNKVFSVNDIPVEKIIVCEKEFIVDKNKLEYEPELYQLSPEHICETITIYIYVFPNIEHVKLIIEKHRCDKYNEVYFDIDYAMLNDTTNKLSNIILTFL